MARTFALLCGSGDTTISWEEHNDAQWLPIIQKMLDREYRFFILERSQRVEATDIEQVSDRRRVVIPDAVLQDLVADAVLRVGGVLLGETTGDTADTPEDVAAHDTLAVPPVAGG